MRSVRSRDTAPELLVRRAATALGFRYRLHKDTLPGKPDLVFGPRRKVIFVHGCFWHGHNCSRGAREPKTNTDYWRQKIQRNRARDANAVDDLVKAHWKVMIIWECQTRDLHALKESIARFMDGNN